MRNRTFYLDTNVISVLADPKQTDPGQLRLVVRLAQSKIVDIVGAVEIMEEFAGMVHSRPDHLERSLELFWSIVGDNVLNGMGRLLYEEIKKGCRLSRKEAMLQRDTVHKLKVLPHADVPGWKEVAAGVKEQAQRFSSGMHSSSDLVNEEMLKRVDDREIRRLASKFEADESTVRDWYKHSLKFNHARFGLSSDEESWPDVAQLPCIRGLFGIVIAIAKKHHMVGRKYYGSDDHDIVHYTNAAMAGCLVTEDGSLRDTARLIKWQPIQVIDKMEFLIKLGTM